MLDLDSGAIHLSYDAGAGATTFCLGIASSTLSSGNRVLWLTREVPDSVRAGQILGDLDKSALDRLVMIEVKGDLNITGVAIMAFLRKMQSADLLIVSTAALGLGVSVVKSNDFSCIFNPDGSVSGLSSACLSSSKPACTELA